MKSLPYMAQHSFPTCSFNPYWLEPYWIISNYFYIAISLNLPLFHFSLEYSSSRLRKIKLYLFLKIHCSASQSLPQLEVISTLLNSLVFVIVPLRPLVSLHTHTHTHTHTHLCIRIMLLQIILQYTHIVLLWILWGCYTH